MENPRWLEFIKQYITQPVEPPFAPPISIPLAEIDAACQEHLLRYWNRQKELIGVRRVVLSSNEIEFELYDLDNPDRPDDTPMTILRQRGEVDPRRSELGKVRLRWVNESEIEFSVTVPTKPNDSDVAGLYEYPNEEESQHVYEKRVGRQQLALSTFFERWLAERYQVNYWTEATAQRESTVGLSNTVKLGPFTGPIPRFIAWLGDETKGGSPKYPYGDGYITVSSLPSSWPITHEYPLLELTYTVITPEGDMIAIPNWAIRFRVRSTNGDRFDVIAECREPAVLPYFHSLIEDTKKSWGSDTDMYTGITASISRQSKLLSNIIESTEGTSLPQRKVGEKVANRAALFKEIKSRHPNWSYVRVAREATENYRDQIDVWPVTEEHVRNAYRAMGWKWERADRIR